MRYAENQLLRVNRIGIGVHATSDEQTTDGVDASYEGDLDVHKGSEGDDASPRPPH